MLKTINKKLMVIMMLLVASFSLLGFTSFVHAATQGIKYRIGNSGEWVDSGSSSLQVYLEDEITVDFVDNGDYISVPNDSSIYIKTDYNLQYRIGNSGEWVDSGSSSWQVYLEDEITVDFVDNGDYISVPNDSSIYISLMQMDNVQPVVSGETTFATDVDERRDLSYFMQWIKAWDETDGDITSAIVVETDNYTANKAVLGTHTVTISVSDSSGNKTTAVINIYVADVTNPVISGSTATATIGYKETWNITNFKSSLTVTDNYDTLTASNITVKTDGYTANKNKLGTYNVVYAVSDSSGNEGTFTKPVKVIDNVKPVFDGPLTISTSNTTIMTESDVRARLTASDEIDGNLTAKITLVEDNYSGKGNKVGSYTIKYSVTDNAGNIAEHTVTINRTDTMPPKIYVENGKTIRIPQGTTITREQILDILESTGVLKVNAMTTFSFPVDEYTGNEETPGAYLMSIKARSTNGNEDLFNVTLQVLSETETPNTDDDIVKGDDKTWFEKNWMYVGIGSLAVVGVVILFVKRKRK